MASVENCFIKSNVDFTTASGWLDLLCAVSRKLLWHVIVGIPESPPTALEKSRCSGGCQPEIFEIAKGKNLCAREVNVCNAARAFHVLEVYTARR